MLAGCVRPWVGLVGSRGAVGIVDGSETGEGLVEFVAGDGLVVDVELGEDGLVEQAALFVVAAAVQLLRLGKQGQASFDQAGAVGEVVVGGLESLGEVRPFGLDVPELLLDLQDRQGGVGGKVEQVRLFGVQGVQLGGELALEEAGGCFLVGQGGGDVLAEVVDELGAEPDGGVVGLDGVFDADDVDVRRGTGAPLLVAAEEVRVGGAAGVDGVLNDELLGDLLVAAASAEQAAFEVVVVADPAFLGLYPRFEEVLDAAEEVLLDQGFMASLELFALVGDDAEVVAVAQHLGQLVDRDLRGRVPLCRAGTEPSVVELVGQVGEGVVAGGIELEGQLHQISPFRVDGDGADLAEVRAVEDVEVAERCPAERAAVLGLLAHLVRDIGAGLAGLVLVEGSQDPVHELSDGCVVNGLGGRDEGDAALTQVGHDDGVVVAVAGHAGELVDDDVVDVLGLADAGEHLLEGDALGHFGGGLARLDVLVHHRQPELVGLAQAGHPLGRDGVAFRVVVGIDLAGTGHSQVDHRPRPGLCTWRGPNGLGLELGLDFVEELIAVGVGAGHLWAPCRVLVGRVLARSWLLGGPVEASAPAGPIPAMR